MDVECDVSSYGLPSFSIVGLGDNAIHSLLYGLANEIEHEEKNANKR